MADNTVPERTGATSISRRTAVAGMLSVAGLAAAACTQYGNTATAPAGNGAGAGGGTGTSGGAGAGAGAAGGAVLGKAADVPVGGGVVLPDQSVVVTQPTAGTFKAFSAVCTHQGCVLADVANGTINCPCHGSKFNIADGSVANGPARTPLPPRSISVNGDEITLA